MVQKPVEDRCGDGLVAEDVAPVGDLLIGGEQNAAALVALGATNRERQPRSTPWEPPLV